MTVTAEEEPAVEVVVVDDSADVRMLLTYTFRTDDRFTVVGEGTNGAEAVELARRLQPDLMVLDRHMPVLGGLEAIPAVCEASPDTAIVLYTAGSEPGTREAAIAAGAVQVVGKEVVSVDLVDELARILLEHWCDDASMVEVVVGPVPSEAARVWVANTRCIVDAVRARPDVIAVPAEVLDTFDRFLDAWHDIAAGGGDFHWVARAPYQEVERLVEYWAAIDAMTDEQLGELGCRWSPPAGVPFFEALTSAVLTAVARHDKTERLAEALRRQWPDADAGGAAAR